MTDDDTRTPDESKVPTEAGVDPSTHGLSHAPLPEGTWLDRGFCDGCDALRDRMTAPTN